MNFKNVLDGLMLWKKLELITGKASKKHNLSTEKTMTEALEHCPECEESRKSKIVNTPVWFECKTCGYTEDCFKGPASTFARTRNPNGPLTQYL